MRRITVLVALACVLLLAVSVRAGAGEKLRIAYLISNFNDNWLSVVAESAKKYGDLHPDIELQLYDAQDDPVKQIDQVATVLQEGIDLLMVIAAESSSVGPTVKMAKEAKVPLLFVNRHPFLKTGNIPEGVFVYACDSKEMGKIGMRYAARKMNGKGNIVLIMGTLNNEAAVERSEGVREVVRNEFPDMKILAEETGNWFREPGMRVCEDLITSFGDKINVIASNNDEMALGGIIALGKANMRDVLVVGVDGVREALDAIKAGTMLCSAFQDPVAQGAGAVEMAVKVANGEVREQYTICPVELITKDNVESFYNR